MIHDITIFWVATCKPVNEVTGPYLVELSEKMLFWEAIQTKKKHGQNKLVRSYLVLAFQYKRDLWEEAWKCVVCFLVPACFGHKLYQKGEASRFYCVVRGRPVQVNRKTGMQVQEDLS